MIPQVSILKYYDVHAEKDLGFVSVVNRKKVFDSLAVIYLRKIVTMALFGTKIGAYKPLLSNNRRKHVIAQTT